MAFPRQKNIEFEDGVVQVHVVVYSFIWPIIHTSNTQCEIKYALNKNQESESDETSQRSATDCSNREASYSSANRFDILKSNAFQYNTFMKYTNIYIYVLINVTLVTIRDTTI